MHVERFRSALLLGFERYGVALCLLAMALITVLSLLPRVGGAGPEGTDKLQHFVAYAVAILPVTQLQFRTQVAFAIGLLICSGVIELIQPYVGRHASFLDLVANAAGLGIGLTLGRVIAWAVFKKSSNTA